MKRHQVVDPTTGRLDLRYNPLSIEEDYYIPVRGQSQTDIQNLAGGQFTGTVEDVKYLRDKLFSALKIPQSYLTMGEGATEDKTTLAQKDIRFARTIQRLQRVVISELEKIGIIHLFTMGFRNDDLLSFSLKLNNPSKIAELQELEQWDKKFSVAGNATEGYFSRRWIAEKLFGLSEEEFLRMQREMYHDRKFAASLEAAGQAPEAGAGGGGLGDLGGGEGDLGDLGGGEGDLGDIGGDAPADEPAGDTGGDDEILLAEPPAKRDDEKKKEDKPKYKRGRYKRHKTSYSKGGLSKQLKRTHTPEFGDTNRTLFPGKSGFGGLDSLARGVTEGTDVNKIEEEKLFSTSRQVDLLIESLLKTKVAEDETQ